MTQKPVKASPRATSDERDNRLDAFVDAAGKASGLSRLRASKAKG